MNDRAYEIGDFLVVRDVQEANQTIAMAGEIRGGVIVRIEQIHSELLICEEAEPPDNAEIKPLPPTYEQSPRLQQRDVSNSNQKVVDDDSRDVSSDVSEYLTKDQDVKSDVLK